MGRFEGLFDQLLADEKAVKQRRHPREEEHRLQVACVNWYRLQHRKYADSLIAVPNGGKRDKTTAKKMKAEGQLAGVADLILLVPNTNYHALLIELKTPKGRQSQSQRAWQMTAERHGYKYVVCRSLDDFITTIKDYLRYYYIR